MGLKNKIIVATMIIRGVVTFGFIAYSMVNFARWVIAERQREIDEANDSLAGTALGGGS
jgi:hypothetical protein